MIQRPEINLITTCPVVVQMRHNGQGWYVNRVIVCDEDIDMVGGHAEDEDGIELPNSDADVLDAYRSAQAAAEWPAWEFGW